MQFNEFLGKVQHEARLKDFNEALRATRATFETLAERLEGEEPAHLAAQLPPELGGILRANSGHHGEQFSPQEFIDRVSQREGVQQTDAAWHAKAVMNVLMDAVSQGEISDVRAQLPKEYQQLFDRTDRAMHH